MPWAEKLTKFVWLIKPGVLEQKVYQDLATIELKIIERFFCIFTVENLGANEVVRFKQVIKIKVRNWVIKDMNM